MTPGHRDPLLVELAADLTALALEAPRNPVVVGVVGSVAAGKSTTAQALAELVAGADGGELVVEVVATDAFLLPNEELEPIGGAMVKGHPQSYDWVGLEQFLADVNGGAAVLSTPVYSHARFDIVPGERHVLAVPDVLIVEGLNLLQRPPTSPVDLIGHLDHSIYLHAEPAVLEQWFVERFLVTARSDGSSPDSFYAVFAGMDDAEVESVARWTWHEINAPNLHRHIAPTMTRADTVVHLAADHTIEHVERVDR